MKKLLTIFCLLGMSSAMAQEAPLLRYPTLSHDGEHIAFSFQGDIWTSHFDGSDPHRITVHQAYDQMPRWSPDDQAIAFSSDRYGNNDLFVISAQSGMPRRITYFSAGDMLSDWSKDNKLLFSTSRNFREVEWDYEIYSASPDGGTPQRKLDAFGKEASLSPNGQWIAFTRGACRVAREDYVGPANREIWLYNIEKGTYTQLTDNDKNDFMPRWQDDQHLAFISARDGRYNVYLQTLKSDGSAAGSPEEKTHFKDYGATWFDVNAQGKMVVEVPGQLYTLTGNEEPKPLQVSISSDYRFDPIEQKSYHGNIYEYTVSPNDKLSAYVIHGDIFVKRNDKEKKQAIDISNSPSREMGVTWLNDSTLLYTSDREGQYDLYLVKSSDPQKGNLYETLKRQTIRLTNTPEDEINPQVSPDGKKIIYRLGRGQLVIADINEKGQMSNKRTLLEEWATPSDVAWSPDSRWISYDMPDLDFNQEVFILNISDASMKPINVSMHPRGDMHPVWSRDGKKLLFLSERARTGTDVWFAWLTKEDWEKTKQDREEGYYFDEPEQPNKEGDKKKKSRKGEEKKEEVKPIKIDTDNIYRRLEHLTAFPGDERSIATDKKGEFVYFTATNPLKNGNDLFKIKFDGTDKKQITSSGVNPYNMTMSQTGEAIYFLDGGVLKQLTPGSDKIEGLPHEADMRINHPEEQEQVFEEGWRALNAGFYDPNYHGYDWQKLHDDFKPICLRASTAQDFRDMFNAMLGQLNSSHMGLYGGNPEETQKEKSGLLGAELKPVSNGVEVTRIIKESPADKEKSKLYVGDVITHIDGHKVEQGENIYQWLIHKSQHQVLLAVIGKDGQTREVVIRPASSLSDEKYKDWVAQKRELVAKYSNGKLGYLHIEGMNWPSFERFERELTASGYGKEGILIDVRYNGGGWTTDYLMTVLDVRQHAYTVPRGATDNLKNHKQFRDYYPFGERLPYAAWTKPSIALCNAESYSNAEIFSHAYKTLNIGTLVGEPTFGAVISTGGYTLLDGSFVRLPFRGWYVKATDTNMEHHPAVPDKVVLNAPDSREKGEDAHLKTAVETLLQQVEAEK